MKKQALVSVPTPLPVQLFHTLPAQVQTLLTSCWEIPNSPRSLLLLTSASKPFPSLYRDQCGLYNQFQASQGFAETGKETQQ